MLSSVALKRKFKNKHHKLTTKKKKKKKNLQKPFEFL